MRRINKGEDWRAIFPGVPTLTIQHEGIGPGLTIRITRNQGEAVQLVKEGDPNAAVVAVKRVNELEFYNLGAREMAKKLGVTVPKMLWVMSREKLQFDPDHHKTIKIGASTHKRYSGKCLQRLRELLADKAINDAYENRKMAA